MDLKKVFLKAVEYPLNPQVFSVMFLAEFVLAYFGFYASRLVINNIESIGYMGLAIIPAALVGMVITIFLTGLYIDNASKFFAGHRKPLTASLPVAKKKFFRLLGAYMLMLIIIMISAAPLLLSGIADAAQPVVSMAGISIIAVVAAFVYLSPYIIVLEKAGIRDSIRISARVVNKNRFGVMVFWVFYLAASVLVGMLISTAALISLAEQNIIVLFAQSLVSAYTALFAHSAFTNLYLSLKKK